VREQITLTILATVFLASALNQLPLPWWQRLVARWDTWTLLPFWGFFGPKPAYAGVHVIFRDRCGSDWTDWREIALPAPNGWRWIWNPTRHERKALFDLVNSLALAAQDFGAPEKVLLSKGHLGLLACVVAQPPIAAPPSTRQFALVEAIGHAPRRAVKPVYISREFSLG
jgi:hypothetical protein